LTLQCPRCPNPCPDRGQAICHTNDCEIHNGQREWFAARTAASQKQAALKLAHFENIEKMKNPNSHSPIGVMRRTMSAAAK
jgi:uncharacterized protein